MGIETSRSVNRAARTARNASVARKRFSLEWLEPRQMLSGSASADCLGAAVRRRATEPVSPRTGRHVQRTERARAIMGGFDVQIEELNRDGTKTPLWSIDDPPNEQSDATGTELIVPLQEFSHGDFSYDNVTLPAGQYEIDLVGGTWHLRCRKRALSGPVRRYGTRVETTRSVHSQFRSRGNTGLGHFSGSNRPVGSDCVGLDQSNDSELGSQTVPVHASPRDISGKSEWRYRPRASAAHCCRIYRSLTRTARCWQPRTPARGFPATRMTLISMPDWNLALTTSAFPAQATCPMARAATTRRWAYLERTEPPQPTAARLVTEHDRGTALARNAPVEFQRSTMQLQIRRARRD